MAPQNGPNKFRLTDSWPLHGGVLTRVSEQQAGHDGLFGGAGDGGQVRVRVHGDAAVVRLRPLHLVEHDVIAASDRLNVREVGRAGGRCE